MRVINKCPGPNDMHPWILKVAAKEILDTQEAPSDSSTVPSIWQVAYALF